MFSARFLRSIQKIQKPEEARRFLRLDQYWCPEVAEALLAGIDDLVNSQPRPALEIAEIALELVGRIRGGSLALQARAFCSLAVAQRFLGKLAESEGNFARASRLAEAGPAQVRALVARQSALLLLDQNDPEAALLLAQQAVRIESAEGILPSKSLLCEAVIRGLRGDHGGAARCCRAVLQQEDPKTGAYLCAMQNLLTSLIYAALTIEDFLEARDLLRQVRQRLRGVRKSRVRFAVWYAEGLLLARMNEHQLAIVKFQQARDGFLDLELLPDYALASLDLAKAHAKRGETDRAQVVLDRTALELERHEANESLLEAFCAGRQASGIEAACSVIRSRMFSPAPVPVEI